MGLKGFVVVVIVVVVKNHYEGRENGAVMEATDYREGICQIIKKLNNMRKFQVITLVLGCATGLSNLVTVVWNGNS